MTNANKIKNMWTRAYIVDEGLLMLRSYKRMNKISIEWLLNTYKKYPHLLIYLWLKERSKNELIRILKINPELWEIVI
jgi:hypothetical protein